MNLRYRAARVIHSPTTQRIKARLQDLSRAGQRPWVLPVGIASLVAAVFLIPAASPVSGDGESDEGQQAVSELSIAASRSTASEAGKVGTPDTVVATIEDNDRPVVSLAASTEPATENGATESTVQTTVTLKDNDLPVVTVTAASTVVPESGPPGLFTISRIGPTTAPLIVSYSVAGSATADVAYENLPGSVTIPAGQLSATVRLVPIDDDLAAESAETVTVGIRPSPDYRVGDPSTATLTLEDDDLPVVSVEVIDGNASEAGPDQAVFTVRRTGQATSELAVTYTLGGTAVNGVDYQTLDGSVVIAQGAAAVTVVIVPIDDLLFEPEETVSFVLVPGAGYEIGDAEGTAIIAPSDVARVDLAREAHTGEGDSDPGAVIVTRTGDLSSDLIISYTVTGSATSGVDYVALTGFVVIPAGEATTIVIVIPIDDEEEEDREEVIITLSPGLAYEIDEDASAMIRIDDNDDEDKDKDKDKDKDEDDEDDEEEDDEEEDEDE